MSIFNILDRKLWSTLLDIDGKIEGINERISSTNERVEKLGKRVAENRERIIKLESDFKNCKENLSEKIKNIFNEKFDEKQALWISGQRPFKNPPELPE